MSVKKGEKAATSREEALYRVICSGKVVDMLDFMCARYSVEDSKLIPEPTATDPSA